MCRDRIWIRSRRLHKWETPLWPPQPCVLFRVLPNFQIFNFSKLFLNFHFQEVFPSYEQALRGEPVNLGKQNYRIPTQDSRWRATSQCVMVSLFQSCRHTSRCIRDTNKAVGVFVRLHCAMFSKCGKEIFRRRSSFLPPPTGGQILIYCRRNYRSICHLSAVVGGFAGLA